jgi:hypothetical protein
VVTYTRLLVIMAVMPVVAALAVIGGVWLTGDLRMVGLVGLATAIIGTAFVGYFNWRAKFQRRDPE